MSTLHKSQNLSEPQFLLCPVDKSPLLCPPRRLAPRTLSSTMLWCPAGRGPRAKSGPRDKHAVENGDASGGHRWSSPGQPSPGCADRPLPSTVAENSEHFHEDPHALPHRLRWHRTLCRLCLPRPLPLPHSSQHRARSLVHPLSKRRLSSFPGPDVSCPHPSEGPATRSISLQTPTSHPRCTSLIGTLLSAPT